MLAVISHAQWHPHDPCGWRPGQAIRLGAICEQMITSGLEVAIRFYDAPLAMRMLLTQAHDEAYVNRVFAAAPNEDTHVLDSDTVMQPETLNAALRAAGYGVLAVNGVRKGEFRHDFCLVRPLIYYAERDRAMRFTSGKTKASTGVANQMTKSLSGHERAFTRIM